jgi:phage tail-like protein
MALATRTDPYLGFHFKVEIQGLVVGGFSEATGLQVEVETEDYQEGGAVGFAHKLPKAMKYPNVVLKRGLTDADALWKWLHSVGKKGSKLDRKTVRIIVLDSEGKEKVSWRCLQALPVKWAASDLKSDANSVQVESLELVHCGIERS